MMLAVLALLLIPLTGLASQADTADAAEFLAKAERAAERMNFTAADQYYRKILKEAPESEEALVAGERLQDNALLYTRPLEIHGRHENRIDVFVLAEGFLRKDQKAFLTQAEITARLFFQVPVFKRYRNYFNFYAMHIASHEEGVDRGDKDVDTALGAHQSQWSQGQVSVDHDAVRSYLAKDERSERLAVVIVRRGTLGTGGGGVAVVGGGASDTVIHEWGHAFGMLLDEYTSDVGYEGDAPRGFNISDTKDPEKVPWKHWLEAGEKGVTIIPGGAGRATGVWRSTGKPCSMARGSSFCIVCREALVANIYGIVSPLDEVQPQQEEVEIGPEESCDFQVVPIEVATKPYLSVEFFLESRSAAAGDGQGSRRSASQPAHRKPGEPGRLQRLRPRWSKQQEPRPQGTSIKPKRIKLPDKRIAWQVTLASKELEPGEYQLHARVTDPTPWLIKEEWLPCLSETHTWVVRVR